MLNQCPSTKDMFLEGTLADLKSMRDSVQRLLEMYKRERRDAKAGGLDDCDLPVLLLKNITYCLGERDGLVSAIRIVEVQVERRAQIIFDLQFDSWAEEKDYGYTS